MYKGSVSRPCPLNPQSRCGGVPAPRSRRRRRHAARQRRQRIDRQNPGDERPRVRGLAGEQIAVGQQEHRIGALRIGRERGLQIDDRRVNAASRIVNPAAQLQRVRGGSFEHEDAAGAALRLDERRLADVDARLAVLQAGDAERGMEVGIVAGGLDPVAQEANGVVDRVLAPAPPFLSHLQVAVSGRAARDWFPRRRGPARRGAPGIDLGL